MNLLRTIVPFVAAALMTEPCLLLGESSKTRPTLQLKLQIREPSVTVDGRLKLGVTITNLGPDPVYIYGDLDYGVAPFAYHRDGAPVDRRTHPHELCPPPPPDDSDFVRLLPGHALSYELERSPRDLGIELSGTYLIELDDFFVAVRDTEGFRISLAEQPLPSNRVEIDVRPENAD